MDALCGEELMRTASKFILHLGEKMVGKGCGVGLGRISCLDW